MPSKKEKGQLEIEEWRTIPGFDGWYEASDQGRVRSYGVSLTAVWRVTSGRGWKDVA